MKTKLIFKYLLFILCGMSLAVNVSHAQASGSYVYIPNNSNIMVYSGSSGTFTLTQNMRIYSAISGNLRKLTSAQRITMAGDDPSGLAVSEKMRSHISALKREIMNAEDFRNYLRYKESVIAQNISIVSRMRELAVQASSGILHPTDRELLQSEVNQLLNQINMNAEFSSFNRKLIIPHLTVDELGLSEFTIVRSPHEKIKLLDDIHTRLIRERTVAGVESNILKLQIEGKSYYMFNLQASESRIRDLDYTAEFSDYSTNSVLYEINTGMILKNK